MVASFLAGDFKTSLAIQLHYIPLIKVLFSDVNPIPVKEAMNYLGYDAGPCRMPLYPMSDETRNCLHSVLASFSEIITKKAGLPR
jgi:4-hydroxy-tetrahydrodipicolinate synthase